MKEMKDWLNIAVRGAIFIYFPLAVLLFWIYRKIFNMGPGIHWLFIVAYLGVFLQWLIAKYRNRTVELEVNNFDVLDRLIEQYKFEVIEIKQTEMIVRPTFDMPLNLILDDKILLHHSNGTLTIEGPKYYINILEKNIQGRESLWTRKSVSSFKFIYLIALAVLPVILESNLVWSMDVMRHNNTRNVGEEVVAISETYKGNTLENTMNGGLAAETGDAIFYIENNMKLVETDEQFENKDYLINRDGGYGYRNLNVVGDWLYFTKGERIERMKRDMGNHTAIYSLGYASQMQIYGNYIYFLSVEDDFSVYRMDLNGNDLKQLIDVEAQNFIVHDGRLLVSREKRGKPVVESYDMNGNNPEIVLETYTAKLTIWNDYYYYLDEDQKLYRTKIEKENETELLVNTFVPSYMPTEKGVVFSLSPSGGGDFGEGLYILDPESGKEKLLSRSKRIRSLAKVGKAVLFTSEVTYGEVVVKQFDLESGRIETLD